MKTGVKYSLAGSGGLIIFIGSVLFGMQQIAESAYRPALTSELQEVVKSTAEGFTNVFADATKLRLRHIRFELKSYNDELTNIRIRMTDPQIGVEGQRYLLMEKTRIEAHIALLKDEKDCIIDGKPNCS